ncbi:MAG: hypothetical protein HY706_13700 [Candidatus Hydrogenedentes bacterium]|nr:hypothetical protein [Candidatus Hydrogenedentota bacterium]
MKKVFAGCLLALLALALAVGGLLFWAFKAGSKQQEEFFAAVYSGNPKQLVALFDPALQAEVDEPVLAEWMKAMQSELGAPAGLSAVGFDTSKRIEGGSSFTESKGTVKFEKGEATSELVLRDGKIVKFNVRSERLGNWFRQLADTAMYRDTGRRCLELMISGQEAEAHAMMHPNLQQVLPLEKVQATMAGLGPELGPLENVTFETEEFRPGEEPILAVSYIIQCEKKKMQGNLKFEFVGLKGHLTAVDLSASD